MLLSEFPIFVFQIISIEKVHNICMVAVENITHLIAENIIQVQPKSIFLLKKDVTLKGVLIDLHMIGQALILLKVTEDNIIVPVALDSTGSLSFIIIFLMSTQAKGQENKFSVLNLFFRLGYAAISVYCCLLIKF